jgi:prepilin-type N-terminal cleavage/methylation domain-containing protein
LNKSGPELSFTGEVFNTQEQVMSNSSRDRWEKKKEKGLSLIELMVGLAILGLIIMSVFAAFPLSRMWLNWAGEISLESTYAASIMELLRNNSLLLQEQVIEAGQRWIIITKMRSLVLSWGACLWKWQCLLECLPELMPGFLMIMPIMTAYQLKVLIKLVAGR